MCLSAKNSWIFESFSTGNIWLFLALSDIFVRKQSVGDILVPVLLFKRTLTSSAEKFRTRMSETARGFPNPVARHKFA